MDDVGVLAGRLQNAGLSCRAHEKLPVAIWIPLYNLLPLFRLLGLIDGPNPIVLLIGQGVGANEAVPGNGTLANVALQRSKVGGRIERHDGRRCRSCRGKQLMGVARWGGRQGKVGRKVSRYSGMG